MSHTANTAHTEPTTRRAARRGAVEDVVVTEDGCRNLSGDWPHTADEVEAWIADVQGR